MEELGLEKEGATKGERDEKSIVAVARDCCCVTAKFCVNAERMDGGSDVAVDFTASDACACVGELWAVYVEELFAGEEVCECECRESSSLVGDAEAVVYGGDEEATTTVGDEAAGPEFALWPAVSRAAAVAALPPFVVREEPDVALDEEALAGDDDAVAAPKASAGRADENDSPPDAFDFPLSVEW